MKKFAITWGIIACLLLSPEVKSQISVNINLNTQPVWGPVGYDYVEYYYLPDIEMYYSVPDRKYIYFHGNQWIWVSSLPSWCNHYDIYSGYKVVLNGPSPYLHFKSHKVKYAKYKNYHGKQVIIKNKNAHKKQVSPYRTHQKSSPVKHHNKGNSGKGGGHKGGHGKGHR
ncbi:MAG: hypothetical protein V4622_13105 [Bacteroidota bacterium]